MIRIVPVVTKKEIKTFVQFPFQLYQNHPYWVPPIVKNEMETFDPTKNPVYEHAESHLFLAYKEDKIVGRIAAIINWQEVKEQQKSKIRFGWWDVIDDIEVTKKLIEKVIEIGKNNQLEHIEGPMGFSNLDKVGVVTEGFDEIGSMITWYNYPYYAEHLEKLGFQIEKKYQESKFPFSNVQPETFEKACTIIEKRYGLKAVSFKKNKDILPKVNEMFEVFNQSYASLASFVAITEREKTYYKEKYISFINPEYIKFVLNEEGKMVAFSIVMPSFSKALQKANGNLFPFGFYQLLKAKKESKDVLFYLIGILPEFQNKGVTALIFKEYYYTFTQKGIKNCIRTPELEENIAIQNIWKNFNPQVFRRRRTFSKNIVGLKENQISK